MPILELVEGGVNGYTGVRVNPDREYEKIEVYSIQTFPARILEPWVMGDGNTFMDMARPYSPDDNNVNLLYRAWGIDECTLYHLGDISGSDFVGYGEEVEPAEEWEWYPTWHNLIRNSYSFQGSSFTYFKSPTIRTPRLTDVYDDVNSLDRIIPFMENSRVWQDWKLIEVPGEGDLIAFKADVQQAFTDIFEVPFGITDRNYTNVEFKVFYNVSLNNSPPDRWFKEDIRIPGRPLQQQEYYEHETIYPTPSLTDLDGSVYVDGQKFSDITIRPNLGTLTNRDETFFKDPVTGRMVSMMWTITVDIPVTAFTETVEVRFRRPADTGGADPISQFRAPTMTFNEPVSSPMARTIYFDASQDPNYDKLYAPNVSVVFRYPYIGPDVTYAYPRVWEPYISGRADKFGDTQEYWELSSNISATVNGYDLNVVRNTIRDKATVFKWVTQKIGRTPRDGRDKRDSRYLPTRLIPPPSNAPLVLPSTNHPGLEITAPMWTTWATDTVGWTEIPDKSIKVYDPTGQMTSGSVKLSGVQKEIFGDVSKIDFTQYKEEVFPMSTQALGRLDIVIPGVGMVSLEPLYLLQGSFDQSYAGGSKTHYTMSGWKQVYVRQSHSDVTTLRVAIKGRAQAVQVLREMQSALYFGLALDEEAKSYFDVLPVDTFAVAGRIQMEEWGTDGDAIVILECDIRRIIRPPRNLGDTSGGGGD